MKNFSGITDNLDITTKKYVDDGLASKANLAGNNTFTGKQILTGINNDYSVNASGYIKGSWLQSSVMQNKGSNTGKVCVFDNSGWIYYRTPAEILAEAGGGGGGGGDNSKHGYTELTNENLNTITEAGWYRAANGNTCTNRPSEISNNGFFLNVEKLNDARVKQEIYVGLDYVSSYTRNGQSAYSGGTLDWSGWSSNMKISDFAQTFSGRKTFSNGINLNSSLQVGGSSGATGQFLMSQGGSTPKWSSIQVKVNGTVYTIDSNGLIDLGTIGGTTAYMSMGNDIY